MTHKPDEVKLECDSWATLLPMGDDICLNQHSFHLRTQHVWVGRNDADLDVNITEKIFGTPATVVHSMHLAIFAHREWLQSVWQSDWHNKTEALHQELASRPLASALVLQPKTKIWLSRYVERTECAHFKCFDSTHGTFEVFHGDAIHFAPPRVTWQVSFMLQIQKSRVQGWMEPDDDDCESWFQEQEVLQMRRRREPVNEFDEKWSDWYKRTGRPVNEQQTLTQMLHPT